MKRYALSLCFLLVMAAGVTAGVSRAWSVSEVYPFKRLPLGNSLHFTTVFGNVPESYDEKILAVDGRPVGPHDDVLSLVAGRSGGTVTYLADTSLRTRNLDQDAFNSDVFAFIIFFMLCGVIHATLSTVVFFALPRSIEARMFSGFEAVIGLYFISLPLYLLCPSLTWLYASASYLLACIVLFLAGRMMLPAFARYRTSLIAGAMIAGAVVSVFFFASGSQGRFHAANSFFCIFSFSALLAAVVLRLRHNPRIPRLPVIMMLFFHAFFAAIPFGMIALAFVVKIDVPLSFFASLTIFIPVLIGVNVAGGSLRNIFTFRRRHLLRLTIDCAISVIFVFGMYVFLASRGAAMYGILMKGVPVAGFVALLGFRQAMVAGFKLYDHQSDEDHSVALRKISELTASPSPIAVKVEGVFSAMSLISEASAIRVELFEKELLRRIDPIPDRIEYSSDAQLNAFFNRAFQTLHRNSLFFSVYFERFEREGDDGVDLLIPVKENDTVIGVLKVWRKKDGSTFHESEIQFLQSASVLLYHLIENEILYMEYSENRRYEKELDAASYVQMRLFPRLIPVGKGFSCSYFSRPFIKVTGDYFDFVSLDDDRTLFAMGDVAGHGLSAATLLAVTDHIIAACVRERKNLSQIFTELNNFFTSRYRGTEIMTLFMMVYDRRSRRGEYINAGHCLPILIRSGQVMRNLFPDRSLVLGANQHEEYRPSLVGFLPGDDIVLYTDGIVEIQKDQQGNNVGDIFLIDVMLGAADESIEEKIGLLSRRLEQFPRNSILDDITVLGLRID